MRGLRGPLFALTVIGATVCAVGVAAAEPIEREHYSGSETFSFDDCGFLVDGVANFSGLFMLKEGRHGDPTPYLFDNYQYEIVYTNAETGAFYTQSGNGLFKDHRITLVEGTVYRFEAMESGRPFEIRDMDGNLILKDRGLLRTSVLIDTSGDSDIDNDIVLDDTFELLADHGAHPGFYADFCELVTDLIG